MRNDLHGRAQIVATPFLCDDIAIDSPRCHIVRLPRRNARKAFIMAKIKIGFRTIVRHIDFAMLIGRHRARIDIQIRIKFPNADFVATRLQKGRQRSSH